jgi:hypothetical protein
VTDGVRHADRMLHVPTTDLEAGFDEVRAAPRDGGTIELISRRPAENERELLEEAEIDPVLGLVGDTWYVDYPEERDSQLTIVNSRLSRLVAGEERARWALSGDQLYADFNIGDENLPVGTVLLVGTATIEITAVPHTGCKKYAGRFGPDATRFVNSPEGRALRLRGVNTRILVGGVVRVGDAIVKRA